MWITVVQNLTLNSPSELTSEACPLEFLRSCSSYEFDKPLIRSTKNATEITAI